MGEIVFTYVANQQYHNCAEKASKIFSEITEIIEAISLSDFVTKDNGNPIRLRRNLVDENQNGPPFSIVRHKRYSASPIRVEMGA